MKEFKFTEKGLLPLEKLMDESLVLITGGFSPSGDGSNYGCNCECSCDNYGCNCTCDD